MITMALALAAAVPAAVPVAGNDTQTPAAAPDTSKSTRTAPPAVKASGEEPARFVLANETAEDHFKGLPYMFFMQGLFDWWKDFRQDRGLGHA